MKDFPPKLENKQGKTTNQRKIKLYVNLAKLGPLTGLT